MRPNLKITHKKKYDAIADAEPTDVEAVFRSVLPEVAFQSEKDFTAATRDVADNFKPPGTLIKTFENEEGPYEIWKGSLADPAVRQLVRRIEVMVLFYIQGGNTIVDESEPDWSLDRWTVYLLYQRKWVTAEKDISRYTFVGYSTVYRFHMLQNPTPPSSPETGDKVLDFSPAGFTVSQLPCRLRISQFIILPPFLHRGNGGRMYQTVFADLLAQENCKEITVEDPNEAFDDLRDHNDLKFIRTLPELDTIKINMDFKPESDQDRYDIVDHKAVEALKKRTKIANRQLGRLLEMHLMSKLPVSVRPALQRSKLAATPNERKMYLLWKKWVKSRLYRHNLELLQQMEKQERMDKLNETESSVELEYIRLLSLSQSRDDAATNGASPNRTQAELGGVGRKRSLDAVDKGEPGSKRARVEDAGDE